MKANLNLHADPLGDLYVEWKIPVLFLVENTLTIDLPTYKYEMSIISGIPIPLSSLAENIDCEIFEISLDGNTERISHEVKKEFKGRKLLIITFDKQILDKNESYLIIQFVVKKLVTKDKVFFNFVYTISSPLSGRITTNLNLIAHFSYHVSSHRLKLVLIDADTGRIDYDTKFIRHWQKGDYIHGTAEEITIPDTGSLDLHVHGSRLPFKIDRRIFWISVFIFALMGVSGILIFVKLIWNYLFG